MKPETAMIRSLVLSLTLLSAIVTGPALAKPPEGAVVVPGGRFLMGCSTDDRDCRTDEGPVGGTAVMVNAFWIDPYEVSVAEYRACVEADACERPFTHARNPYCNYDAPDRNAFPLNCVDWFQARDYCSWRGARLPTEAEWEKAARGGTTTRYPWGDEAATCEYAVMDDGVYISPEGETDGCGRDRLVERGTRAPNPYGLYDMHGSVSEWVYNWYAPDAITELYGHQNLTGPDEGRRRVIRGGAWDEGFAAQRSSSRWAKVPKGHRSIYGSNGFRCAGSVEAE
jgi:iron(II)-dependent oxidoreductase